MTGVITLPSLLFNRERTEKDTHTIRLTSIRLISPEQIQPLRSSWEVFLAHARKRFIVDELIRKNDLSSDSLVADVLEIDNKQSLLTQVLRSEGYRSLKLLSQQIHSLPDTYEAGVSATHNLLDQTPSIEHVDRLLDQLAQKSKYGMVHQVRATDDPIKDSSQRLELNGTEWDMYFQKWADRHYEDGWVYLGNHRGMPHRPRNFVLEKNGSFPFYKHYDQQVMRKLVAELTLANGVSATRIPLLLFAFSIGQENPYLFSALVAIVHALDIADGKVARLGFGNSPQGPNIDIYSDHLVEVMTAFHYAYTMKLIPKTTPWIYTARNASTDILRAINSIKTQEGTLDHHPLNAFGTDNRISRFGYGAIKLIGDCTIPIIPSSGKYVTAAHIAASIHRAVPVWANPKSQAIYKELLEKIMSAKLKQESQT